MSHDKTPKPAPAETVLPADEPIPKGFMPAADGSLHRIDRIKPLDKARHALVTDLAERAKAMSNLLGDFKAECNTELDQFVAASAAEYGKVMRGAAAKGNITITSFDGRFKIERKISDRIAFDERLQVAKALIDKCLQRWQKGSNANLQTVVNRVFKVDKGGNVSAGDVLGLRSYDIKDDEWARAMEAITDSITVMGSVAYLRFYERDDRGQYHPIGLSTAAV